MADEYIKREDAMAFRVTGAINDDGRLFIPLREVEAHIRKIPAEDVRPVVYCQDCIYDDHCFAQSVLEETSRIPFDKNRFFCPDGKRRDGGADG